MTLIKDLINIPDHTSGGDYVLALTSGVEQAEKTVQDYVVTDQLVDSFNKALTMIRDSLGVSDGIPRSKAAYLHGSFGSGKSHFMAVLDLLLAGDPHARSIHELSPVIAANDSWLKQNKFLLIPYHLIGAENLEAAIFGGYIDWIRKEHPEAPLPAVHQSDLVLDNAIQLRQTMGDEAFFAKLNGGSQPNGGAKWGKMSSGWNAERFDTAVAATGQDETRLALISRVVSTVLTAFQGLHGGYVPIDEGLSIITKHARSLGYDALVLFLDELILWLAGRVKADLAWAREEGSKLAKLVESGDADRPIPIVSFIARQRILRELAGGATGQDQADFFAALEWWEGRFETITLEDKNLPVIANRRMLQPVNETAAKTIQQAFEDAFKQNAAAADVLLGAETERRQHAKLVYPFSPALITTLVDVSSILQRNRTALKVMQALLVNQRETLSVGELIPVGELYDVIASEDQPFSPTMQLQFDNAKAMYNNKIRPKLLARHSLDGEPAVKQLPPNHAFHADDRLTKTVILAALVPATPALQNLTASKLEALNAGSVQSFIPGDEISQVIDLFRWLASNGIGEFELTGENTNPRIGLRLHGIDIETIVAGVKGEDTINARRRKVRDLLAGAIEEADLFTANRHHVTWRGTKRQIEIVFGNIRSQEDLPDDQFDADQHPKIVIDFPFDPEVSHVAKDDIARVNNLQSERPDTTTICWVPSHLNEATLEQLGRLVMLDHLNAGDNFERNAGHLPQDDRALAKRNLASQAQNLKGELLAALEEAYAIKVVSGPTRHIDEPLDANEQFASLHHGLTPQRPAAATLADALDRLSDQLLSFQLPAHPKFSSEIKPADIVKVWEQIKRSAQEPNGRLEFFGTEKHLRDLMLRIATPLELGITEANHFVLADTWKNRLTAAIAKELEDSGDFTPTVGWLRERLDEPARRGLTKESANLVIATFALQTDHSFTYGGEPQLVDVKRLEDDYQLEQQTLPSNEVWAAAIINAQSIFGWNGAEYRSAENVAKLANDAATHARTYKEDVKTLRETLNQHRENLGIDDNSDRVQTSEASAALIGQLTENVEPIEIITRLQEVNVPTSTQALGTSIKSSKAVTSAIRNTNWDFVKKSAEISTEGSELTQTITQTAERDEFSVSLAGKLPEVSNRAGAIVLAAVSSKPALTSTSAEIVSDHHQPRTGTTEHLSSQKKLAREELDAFVTDLKSSLQPDQQVTITWEIHNS